MGYKSFWKEGCDCHSNILGAKKEIKKRIYTFALKNKDCTNKTS